MIKNIVYSDFLTICSNIPILSCGLGFFVVTLNISAVNCLLCTHKFQSGLTVHINVNNRCCWKKSHFVKTSVIWLAIFELGEACKWHNTQTFAHTVFITDNAGLDKMRLLQQQRLFTYMWTVTPDERKMHKWKWSFNVRKCHFLLHCLLIC